MNLGKNIYELRKAKAVTQEELAAELGVTAAAVSKWEKGATLPDVLMVCAIADYFGVTTDELLGRSRELKKLVILEQGEDRKLIERLLKNHGFCATAYATDPSEAGRLKREKEAVGVLRIGRKPITPNEQNSLGKCNLGDCAYDEPEDLPGNLDTILSMMEKHF